MTDPNCKCEGRGRIKSKDDRVASEPSDFSQIPKIAHETTKEIEVLSNLFKEMDISQQHYIQDLSEIVSIKSISSRPEHRNDIVYLIQWTADRLNDLGAQTHLCEIGSEKFPDGSEIPLPPILFGSIGNDPNKKTVLIYGHLDVQPASITDGWNTEPFEMTEVNGKLYGRGTTDDKGPVLCWLHAIEAYKKIGVVLPINVKFVFEGMQESDSKGLDSFLHSKKDSFLADIDYICVSDSYWLGTDKPCITYGLRGLCYFAIEVEGSNQDLNSASLGGNVYEAMSDLIYLMNTLVDKEGKILIPDIYNDVATISKEEIDLFRNIDFDVGQIKNKIGCKKLQHDEDKIKLLLHRWCEPCLSLHGIEGAYNDHEQKTVIPKKVVGKFSLRIVPNQTAENVEKLVIAYLEQHWQARGSPNNLKIKILKGLNPWLENMNHPNYIAARNAIKYVFGVEPDCTREGGSIRVAVTLHQIIGKNIVLLPIGQGNDAQHSQNEKIDITNYIKGTKLLGAYLFELSST